MLFVNVVLMTVAVVLLIPATFFCLECLLALLPKRHANARASSRPSIAILMPAHNENAGIVASIQAVAAQLAASDRLIVIADNCTDDTAQTARDAGAMVIERTDPTRRGKGFALDFGVRHLEQTPPDVVVIMDSDCIAQHGMLDALAEQVASTQRPAQAIYLMEHPQAPGVRDLVSALAFQVKNEVRPSGLNRIGLPCLLTGTGMAFPWADIASATLSTGNIVEDMQLGIDLTLARRAPLLCNAARVFGRLPANEQAVATQRRRWEHGHLYTLRTQVPRLLFNAVTQLNVDSAAIAFDLAVPPLSLLVVSIGISASIAATMTFLGASAVPAILLGAGFGGIGLCVLLAWATSARKTLPLRTLLAAPLYMLWKIPIYLQFLIRRETQWQRTDRSQAATGPSPRRLRKRRFAARPSPLPAITQRHTVTLGNVAVDSITEAQCIERILAKLDQGRGGVVITPNLDHLRRCARDPEYANMLTAADIVVADGMPLVWASKLQGTPLPERVAGSDLISSLAIAASEKGKSIFLLGGAPGTAEASAEVLRQRTPSLNLAGIFCPPIGFEDDTEVLPELLESLRASSPDIVFVGLGSPKQEKLISLLRDKFPRTWWLGVGYSFSFLSGEASRAPMWMQKHGLEWAHRLVQDPKRLAKRYLVDNLPFAASLIGRAVANGLINRLQSADSPTSATIEPALAATNVDMQLPSADPTDAKVISQSIFLHPLIRSSVHRVLYGSSERRVRPIELPSLDRLRSVVLLSGSVTPGSLGHAIDRSILDLPLHDGHSLLSHWHRQVRDLRRSIDVAELPLVVMLDRQGMIPLPPPRQAHVPIRIQRDPMTYRGTGGVLRDFSMNYQDDDYILVASAAQSMIRPLADVAESLASRDADLSFISPTDGTPSGLMLIRCAVLKSIPKVGYIDLKEQAMPSIARHFDVAPLIQSVPAALPVRTLTEYLSALKYHARQSAEQTNRYAVYEEEHSPSFSVIEKGAIVDPTARVHDSVVLRNARVNADAVVVRSVVCPGGVIRENATALDEVVMSLGAA